MHLHFCVTPIGNFESEIVCEIFSSPTPSTPAPFLTTALGFSTTSRDIPSYLSFRPNKVGATGKALSEPAASFAASRNGPPAVTICSQHVENLTKFLFSCAVMPDFSTVILSLGLFFIHIAGSSFIFNIFMVCDIFKSLLPSRLGFVFSSP